MKQFEQYVNESIIDIPKANLDPTVFDLSDAAAPPFLKPIIKKQIIEDVDKFADIMGINRFYIVGSILSKTYSEDSDIDVNIEGYNNEIDDMLQGQLLTLIRMLNGRLAAGTTHPINYYILLDDPDESRFDAMYDVANDKWIKEPTDVQFNVLDYMNNFQKVVAKIDLTVAQLRRDIIDYDTLENFDQDEIKNLQILLKRKLIEITDKIETLADIRNTILRKRKKAFVKPMTPEEIHQYKSRNLLPENILHKMLERYYYWKFIKKLEAVLDNKETLEPNDIKKLKSVDRAACLKTFESYVENGSKTLVNEKIRNLKVRKIDWKDPHSHSKSFMHKVNRGMNRKNLTQVPVSQQANRSLVATSNVGSAKKIIDVAKKAPSGIWRITPTQVQWLAARFHHIPPDAKNNTKHLGNTGIIVWRKARGVYYLVKKSSHIMHPR